MNSDTTPSDTSIVDKLNIESFIQNNSPTQWMILLVSIVVGGVASKIISGLFRRFGEHFAKSDKELRSQIFTSLASPVGLFLMTVPLAYGLFQLNMSVTLQYFSQKCLLLLQTIAIFWFFFNFISIIDIYLTRKAQRTESGLDDQIIPIIRKTMRIFLVVIGVLFTVDTVFEKDIGAWLAGLGVAGLAISLAAQDSLKNLFGSITILLDRPFKMGDHIVYNGQDGVVEEIGFRSVKVRTLDGHMVTVPNANIVNDVVRNISARHYIKRVMNITITYDTPKEKILQAVQILKDLLNGEDFKGPIHGRIGNDEFPPRVFFNDFNSDSLNLQVIFWYFPPEYWDFMEYSQRLNLRIFEEYEKAGIEFAFPTQTLYLAGDPKRELAVKMLQGGAS